MADRRTSQRLPDAAHTSRPWRIHELAPDFRLEDVWALPTPGGPADFPRLVQNFASADSRRSSRAVRTLSAIREKLGKRLGWDDPDAERVLRGRHLEQILAPSITSTVPRQSWLS